MSATKDVREAVEAEPGFDSPIAPADISVKNVGGEVALNDMDASGACQRLIEVM